jgi:hypothetical protein
MANAAEAKLSSSGKRSAPRAKDGERRRSRPRPWSARISSIWGFTKAAMGLTTANTAFVKLQRQQVEQRPREGGEAALLLRPDNGTASNHYGESRSGPCPREEASRRRRGAPVVSRPYARPRSSPTDVIDALKGQNIQAAAGRVGSSPTLPDQQQGPAQQRAGVRKRGAAGQCRRLLHAHQGCRPGRARRQDARADRPAGRRSVGRVRDLPVARRQRDLEAPRQSARHSSDSRRRFRKG